ncbi:MAG TPA: branched-chain amino acid ABC transporter permease [Candidatus Limnocylindria bacterium]|jgi:branched-chain amino acid transport system permease protein|nr:branched-chain amino acid ABC transporter permease [Candidatus Limnocylindria bacterium]
MQVVCPGGSGELIAAGLVIGLSNGALIALIAIGYTLVYGIIELINFSHGDLFMLGTFVALTVLAALGFDQNTSPTPWLALVAALVVAMIFCGILNVLAERIAYRRLRNAPRLAPLISAIGVSFIYINVGLFWRGPTPITFPDLLPNFDFVEAITGTQSLIRFNAKDAFVVGMAIPLMVALGWVIKNTKMGKAMRAVAQDREAALQMGVDVDRVISFTFLLGGLLAGAAALMHGLYNGNTVFTLGFTAGLKAFTAAVLGGIGNVTGAALGGVLLGLLGAMTVTCYGGEWENVGVFSLLVIILVFRPTGLLGEQTPERG